MRDVMSVGGTPTPVVSRFVSFSPRARGPRSVGGAVRVWWARESRKCLGTRWINYRIY